MSSDSSLDTDSIDPSEFYTIEDFVAEQDVLDSVANRIGLKLKEKIEEGVEPSHKRRRRRSGPRRYIARDREGAHSRLVSYYFSDQPMYTDEMFRRRFRMRRPLFLRIVSALGEWNSEFRDSFDATNRAGLSPLQKCTAAIRMLAYGTSADQLDEILMIGASTALKCLEKFVEGVIAKFGPEYLRPPRCDEVENLLKVGESRGFPGMVGSIDCMHWAWKNCPVAWRGQFTRGDQGVPTMILEAVASHDLRIWHAFFGVAGSNNDINVLNQSPLFIESLKEEAPRAHFTVNGTQYDRAYYLADGIYPEWAVFMKTIPLPQVDEDKLFALHQEGARKDVERAFGVLQSRFNIVSRPARLWKRSAIGKIMKACVILHNMIVEDERELINTPLDLNQSAESFFVLPPEVKKGDNAIMADVLKRNSSIRARPTHVQLKKDLVEHIWQLYGNNANV